MSEYEKFMKQLTEESKEPMPQARHRKKGEADGN